MRARRTCDPSAIEDMPTLESRFSHVVKHLYCRAERWELAVAGLPADRVEQAAAAGCARRSPTRLEPSYLDAHEACRARVLDDHDRFYAPAYRAALDTSARAGRWGRCIEEDRRQDAFVGDSGVFVIAKHARGRRKQFVATAYRVFPRGIRPEQATAEDFFQAAVDKLHDKTTYTGEEQE